MQHLHGHRPRPRSPRPRRWRGSRAPTADQGSWPASQPLRRCWRRPGPDYVGVYVNVHPPLDHRPVRQQPHHDQQHRRPRSNPRSCPHETRPTTASPPAADRPARAPTAVGRRRVADASSWPSWPRSWSCCSSASSSSAPSAATRTIVTSALPGRGPRRVPADPRRPSVDQLAIQTFTAGDGAAEEHDAAAAHHLRRAGLAATSPAPAQSGHHLDPLVLTAGRRRAVTPPTAGVDCNVYSPTQVAAVVDGTASGRGRLRLRRPARWDEFYCPVNGRNTTLGEPRPDRRVGASYTYKDVTNLLPASHHDHHRLGGLHPPAERLSDQEADDVTRQANLAGVAASVARRATSSR